VVLQPRKFLSNLNLQAADAEVEIQHLKKAAGRNEIVIMDTTPLSFQRNPAGLVKLSKSSGVKVLCCASPPSSVLVEIEQMKSEADTVGGSEKERSQTQRRIEEATKQVECEVRIGISGTRPAVYAGALGGFLVGSGKEPSAAGAPLSSQEEIALEICGRASLRLGGAPVIVFLHAPTKGCVSRVLDILGEAGARADRVALFNVCGAASVSGVAELKEEALAASVVLERGAFLGFTCSGFDGSGCGRTSVKGWEDREVMNPLHNPQNLVALLRLLMVDPALKERVRTQLLLSPGIRLKSDLRRWGGMGMSFVFTLLDNVFEGLETGTGGDMEGGGWSMDAKIAFRALIFSENPIRLLSFPWKPPESVAIEVDRFSCWWCGTEKRVDEERYSKYDFEYCGLDCLEDHRKTGFSRQTQKER